jgi:aminodeoxyfutalosine deaminase
MRTWSVISLLPSVVREEKSEPSSFLFKSCVHRAGWVLETSERIHRNGYVSVENGTIRSVGSGQGPKGVPIIDHGQGVLTAALVNAHTHLELSALRGQIPMGGGFQNWVATLIEKRSALTESEMAIGISEGIQELIDTGCAVIGEISSLGQSWSALQNSGLSGLCFQEFLGNIAPKETAFARLTDAPLQKSLAGHAPHTSAPDLLIALKNRSREQALPFSIHLSESLAEHEFITTATGQWAGFLTERGIDFTTWGLPAPSPVAYLDRIGLLDAQTIAVHLLFTRPEDIDLLAKRNTTVCVCPRSNLNLHGRLPDLQKMMQAGLTICMGTDSLASAPSLNLWEEMRLIAEHFPMLSLADIWNMATFNGALALGLSKLFGSLERGHRASMVYVPIEATDSSNLLEKLVYGEK